MHISLCCTLVVNPTCYVSVYILGQVLSTLACTYSHHQYTTVRISAYLFITLSMFIYYF
jgi:hypothetical protein